jgi:hypothetical protein
MNSLPSENGEVCLVCKLICSQFQEILEKKRINGLLEFFVDFSFNKI